MINSVPYEDFYYCWFVISATTVIAHFSLEVPDMLENQDFQRVVLAKIGDKTMGYYQSLIACILYTMVLIAPLTAFVIFANCFPYLAIAYLIWMVNDRAPFTNGRSFKFMRKWGLWVHFKNYFPCKLIFDDLPNLQKHKQLLYGSSPHGIIATSTHISFGTEANSISKYLPAITPVTLNFNFYVPFVREFFLACGYQSCCKKSCEYILKHGRSLLIVIGGAQEVHYVDATHYRLIVKKRRGFFKLALKFGVPVVPVLSMGENSIYTYIQSPRLQSIQQQIKNTIGVVVPLFHGLKFLNAYSLIPHQEPLTTIVGRAIPCVKNINPTSSEIDELQDLYVKELEHIFMKYRDVYGPCITKLTVE
eukprot:NODE_665_length_5410_cov_0.165317.p3 type:complete len:362 gc:universal NODE_665_length_5410_cov_0.165317:2827-1742(-)